ILSDSLRCEEDIGVTVAVLAALGLRRYPLDVMRGGLKPRRAGVEVRQQVLPVEVEAVRGDGHMPHQYVLPGALRRPVCVQPDAEVHPRRVHLVVRDAILSLLHVAAAAVCVFHRVAHLAGNVLPVDGVLLDTGGDCQRGLMARLAAWGARALEAMADRQPLAMHLVAVMAG